MALYALQATFGKGEASPRLHSRADLEYFKAWLKVCKNWTVMRQGGLRRRPGTEFILGANTASKPVRIIPFIFSADQAYVLELGDFYMRVFANGGMVSGVYVTTPWAAEDLFALDYDQTNDVMDVTHKNYPPYRIVRRADNDWAIELTPTFDGPYLSINTTSTTLSPSGNGNAIPSMTSNTTPSGTCSASSTAGVTAPWYAFDGAPATWWQSDTNVVAASLQYQFASSKTIVGYTVQSAPGYTDATNNGTVNAPCSWTFEGWTGSAWAILDTQFGQSEWSAGEARFYSFSNANAYAQYRINVLTNNGGVAVAIATLAFQQDPASATAITITASGTTGINNGQGFVAGDVGRYITLLGSDAIFHPFLISGYTSSTAKAAGAPLPSVSGGPQWKISAWGSVQGYPAHVCTFLGRKVFARTNGQPSTVWLTKTGGYGAKLDFSTTVPTQDDDAITLSLSDVNEIQWIAEGPGVLFIGTSAAVRVLGKNSENLPFSASNFKQSPASFFGSQAVRPTKAGASTVFVSRYAHAIREVTRSDNGVDFVTPDISVLSEHLFAKGVVDATYQQEPDSLIWWVRGDGALVSMTYEKEQSMAAIHWHQLGGDGMAESICTIPGADRYETWLVVARNGGSVRYIERLAKAFDEETDSPEDAWVLDCALRYSGAPATVISNLDHLDDSTVAILADGARQADQVVSGGEVTLDFAASKVLVGLPFQSRARTMPSNVAVGDGAGLGRLKKIVKTSIDVLSTGSLMVGSLESNAEEGVFRATTDDLGEAVPLVTGFLTGRFDASWRDNGEIEMIADGPFPATVRSVILVLEPGP
jgi:hypothetical protein